MDLLARKIPSFVMYGKTNGDSNMLFWGSKGFNDMVSIMAGFSFVNAINNTPIICCVRLKNLQFAV